MQRPGPAMQGETFAPPQGAERASLSFSLGEALDAAMTAMKKRGVALTGAQLVAALPGFAASLAARFIAGDIRFLSRAYYIELAALGVLGAIASALLRGGLLQMALDASRDREVRFGDLARGVRFFFPMLALELVHVLVLVVSAPLLFVPYVYVWMGFALAPVWLVDRDRGLISAMRASWRAAHGERWRLFGFFIATAAIGYLGLAACCVGTFPAAALASVATAHVYLRLSGEPSRQPDQ